MNHKVNIIICALFLLELIMIPKAYAFEYDNHWAKDEIQTLIERNVITDFGDSFDPDSSATIEEISKVIVKLILGYEEDDEISFLTVAQEHGFLENYSELNSCMTREEMAIIVFESLNIENDITKQTSFVDDDHIEQWVKGKLAKLQEMNIFIGYPDGTFMPKNNITKAELAMVISRCDNYLANEITISKDDENVSKLEIGFFKYDNDSLIISPIEDSLQLNVGDSIILAISFWEEDFDNHLLFEVDNPEVVRLDEKLYKIEALKVGTANFSVHLDNHDAYSTFVVNVSQ